MVVSVPRWAAGVCAGVHAAGVRDVVYVPDNPLSHVLRELVKKYNDIRLVLATREEEAFGIAAGLYLGGRRAVVMLQSSGVGNSLNALTSLLIPYAIPVPMVVSMRGDEGEWNAAQAPMGRGIRGIFDAIAIPHVTVASSDATADTVGRAVAAAFESKTTCACLLPRLLTTLQSDTASDSESETVSDSEPETVSDSESETVSDSESETVSDTDSDTGGA